jgi:peptidoglycan/xylan/chitin deacetylase (PgdA/CDA1 family)
LPKQGVVLTFDDGYADNLWNAKPLLEKYKVPATVFVASGCIDNNGFWWDELEQVLLKPKKIPKSLQLNVQGRLYEWPTSNLNQRKHAYLAIHKILLSLKASDRDQLITELFAWAGLHKIGRSDHRPLTTAELLKLSQSEFIDIGAHTVTHASLSILTRADQIREIDGSRERLTAILGNPVDTFSYPYGNFTPETVDIVKSAGFETALTTETNAVEVGANQFQLGRFEVGDWEGEEFKHHLYEFFRTL